MITSSDGFDAKARRDAEVFCRIFYSLKRCMLTVFIYLSIFEITVPVSTYLQTASLNLFQAYHLVQNAVAGLKDRARKFENVHICALIYMPTRSII